MAKKIQVKLILLLRSTGMSQRAICKSRHMSRSSVSEVFRIAEEKQLTYADVESLSNSEVYSMFFPDKFPEETTYTAVDYAYVHNELKRPGVTLKRLWKEYRQRCTDTERFHSATANSVTTTAPIPPRRILPTASRTSQATPSRWTGAEPKCTSQTVSPVRLLMCICSLQYCHSVSIPTSSLVLT